MATNGTAHEGIDEVLLPQFYQALTDASSLQLILYTNLSNSVVKTHILSDLIDPTGTGYARQTLGGTWSSNNGVFSYNDPALPTGNIAFTNSGGTDWTGDVTGAALISTTYLLHWKDFAAGPVTVIPGRSIEIDLTSVVT